MSTLPEILLWDEEAPPTGVLHYHPESDSYFWAPEFDPGDGLCEDVTDNIFHKARALDYDRWEAMRLEKRDAAIAILRPGIETADSDESDEKKPGRESSETLSESVIGELWPS